MGVRLGNILDMCMLKKNYKKTSLILMLKFKVKINKKTQTYKQYRL